MGWGRMLLLGDFGQQMDLDDMQRAVDQMRAAIHSAHGYDRHQDSQIAALQRENDELKLYVGALVQLLVKKNVVSASEIDQVVNAVEADDVGGRGGPSATRR